MDLLKVVREAFDATLSRLEADTSLMPMNRWNESVFRYSFCHSIATAHPEVRQLLECDKIDLVLSNAAQRAFVEFKFYQRSPRFDPYSGSQRGYKGGPSAKNLAEFRDCIDCLCARSEVPELAKYVVLVYADPIDRANTHFRFEDHYVAYQHPVPHVAVRELATGGPFVTGNDTVSARLYQVTAA
jgi:hypothetical protein